MLITQETMEVLANLFPHIRDTVKASIYSSPLDTRPKIDMLWRMTTLKKTQKIVLTVNIQANSSCLNQPHLRRHTNTRNLKVNLT